jgi:competence protein ComFC
MIIQTKPLAKLYKKPTIVWSALNFLFPPFCCYCGVLGYELCPECMVAVKTMDQNNLCPICGDFSIKHKICSECQNRKPFFDQLRSWGVYSGVLREVIRKIKFNRGLGLLGYFANPSIELIKSWNIEIDHIVPVPLGKTRRHSRGYNQAELIAKPISIGMHIPYKTKALSRIKETSSQVGLNANEREANVLDAFEADLAINQNKSILVIDDITTTGSTVNECAKALRKAGAKNVFCYTLARTPISKNLLVELEAK